MSVRAKFKVHKIERQSYSRQEKGQDGVTKHVKCELQTIVLQPVYSSDPASENRKFWDASPAGEIRLGTINADAAAQFELDGEYYIDFTKAEAGDAQAR